ncbi:MAG: PAS domain-containing protein [Acidobacteriota bacterium]
MPDSRRGVFPVSLRTVGLGALVLGVGLVPLFVGAMLGAGDSEPWGWFHLGVLALVGAWTVRSLRDRRMTARRVDERGFWLDLLLASLAIGLSAWLEAWLEVLRIEHVATPLSGAFDPAVCAWGAQHLAVLAAPALLLLAVERRPDLRGWMREGSLERKLVLPTVTLGVLGLTAYMTLGLRSPGIAVAGSSIDRVATILCLALVARAAWRALRRPADPWRDGYLLIAGTGCLLALTPWIASAEASTGSGIAAALALVPLAVIAVTVPRRGAGAARRGGESTHFGLATQTMMLALAGPLAHSLLQIFATPPPELHARRLLIVLAWIALLGSLAAIQSRLLDRRLTALWSERRRLEARITSSTQRARLAASRHSAKVDLDARRRRLAAAVRSYPRPVVLSLARTGQYLMMNDLFARLVGRPRSELIGQTSLEIGIWNDAGDRQGLLRALRRGDPVENLRFEFRNARGQLQRVSIAVELFDIDGEEHLLWIALDLRHEPELAAAAEPTAALLDRVDALVVLLDVEGRVRFWSGGAERATGRPASEVLGRACRDVFGAAIDRVRLRAVQTGEAIERCQIPVAGSGPDEHEVWISAVPASDHLAPRFSGSLHEASAALLIAAPG